MKKTIRVGEKIGEQPFVEKTDKWTDYWKKNGQSIIFVSGHRIENNTEEDGRRAIEGMSSVR